MRFVLTCTRLCSPMQNLYNIKYEPVHSISFRSARAPKEDTDQLPHPCSLITAFTGHYVSSKYPNYRQVGSEHSDQILLLLLLLLLFPGRTFNFVVNADSRLI